METAAISASPADTSASPVDIRELAPEAISEIVRGMGEPAYRGGQIFSWLHREAATTYEQMTNISKNLRSDLERDYPLYRPELRKALESADGTRKYLFALRDGQLIESVLMGHGKNTGHVRQTVCLSSQVGCAMGCAFCSTGTLGFKRNLTAGEIVSQAIEIAANEKTKIQNVVFMGMGEPLLNESAVLQSVSLLTRPGGHNISARRITVSTCGIPDGIRNVARWAHDVVLAVSLCAADDAKRSSLMPVNKRYPLAELMKACRDYRGITGKRITFEYVMIKNVNIGEDDAASTGKLLNGISYNINLIPVNPGPHGFIPPDSRERERFIAALRREGISAVIRQERGSDISGACGQLAARYE